MLHISSPTELQTVSALSCPSYPFTSPPKNNSDSIHLLRWPREHSLTTLSILLCGHGAVPSRSCADVRQLEACPIKG